MALLQQQPNITALMMKEAAGNKHGYSTNNKSLLSTPHDVNLSSVDKYGITAIYTNKQST